MRNGLAAQLWEGTRTLHEEVERTGIMAALLRGTITRDAYARLLRNLHAIYAALEPALERNAAHPCIAPIVSAGLARSAALAADLDAVHGDRWAEQIAVDTATAEYVERIAALEAADPVRLVAHTYVRYLGDLSGGQILRRIVSRSLGLGEDGLRFYDFKGMDTAAAAARFRRTLDRLPLHPDAGRCIVAEARLGFALHDRLFVNLAMHPGKV